MAVVFLIFFITTGHRITHNQIDKTINHSDWVSPTDLTAQALAALENGEAALNRRRFATARTVLQNARDLFFQTGDLVKAVETLTLLARVETELGHYDLAATHLALARALMKSRPQPAAKEPASIDWPSPEQSRVSGSAIAIAETYGTHAAYAADAKTLAPTPSSITTMDALSTPLTAKSNPPDAAASPIIGRVMITQSPRLQKPATGHTKTATATAEEGSEDRANTKTTFFQQLSRHPLPIGILAAGATLLLLLTTIRRRG